MTPAEREADLQQLRAFEASSPRHIVSRQRLAEHEQAELKEGAQPLSHGPIAQKIAEQNAGAAGPPAVNDAMSSSTIDAIRRIRVGVDREEATARQQRHSSRRESEERATGPLEEDFPGLLSASAPLRPPVNSGSGREPKAIQAELNELEDSAAHSSGARGHALQIRMRKLEHDLAMATGALRIEPA
jgi:hypothetical protein